MTEGKKITWRVTDKNGNEIQPKHRDLLGGLSAAELLRNIEADRQRTAKLIGFASAAEMEEHWKTELSQLTAPLKHWSPAKELKTLAAQFAEMKNSVDTTLGRFTDAQEFLRQSGLSEFSEAVKLFSGKQTERIPAQVKPAPPKVEQTASGLSVVKRSSEIETVEIDLYPPQPDRDGWDAVFNWYYSAPRWLCKDGLRTISEMTTYSYGYVRTMHGHYVAQYGERPIKTHDKMSYTFTAQGRKM